MNNVPSAGWYSNPDPTRRNTVRYWDGRRWTDAVRPVIQQGSAAVPLQNGGADGPPNRADYSAYGPEGVSSSGVFGFGKRKALEVENSELRGLLARLGAADLPEVAKERDRLQSEIVSLSEQVAALNVELANARSTLVNVQDDSSLQSFGLFEFYNPAQDSVDLGQQLESVRFGIKDMIRRKDAILATNNFTFNNSAAKGRQFVNNMSKIMLRAYNAEAENCVKTVRAGNLPAATARLSRAVDQIQRNGTMIDLRVSPSYHALRLQELELAARFQMAKQLEKELERERRAELREQQRAAQELAAERAKIEKERQHYANALAALLAKGDEAGAARLRSQIEDADQRLADVDYRLANERAGYVYVISNVGAFGPRMVKIGMTRRLEPRDRVRELGDASVPFRFDTHALFFSTDAVSLENRLHKAFADKRVNRVNQRREFFYVTPAEVLDVLRREVAEVVEFVSVPEAEEFRLSGGRLDDGGI